MEVTIDELQKLVQVTSATLGATATQHTAINLIPFFAIWRQMMAPLLTTTGMAHRLA